MGRENATACYRELGAELRERRAAAGLTAAGLARRTGWSLAKISRIESGHNSISDIEMLHYLGFCGIYLGAAGDLVALCLQAESGRRGYWLTPRDQQREDLFRSLIYHEAAADASTTYEPELVPGLLQTTPYTYARIAAERWRTPEDVDRLVRIRLERQRILHVPQPSRFTFFVHEQALRVQVGSTAIMHEQLLQIVFLTALGHLTVRVVPSSVGERSAFGGPFRLFEFAKHQPLAYLDNHSSGLFLEDPDYVEPYRTLLPAIDDVALDTGQSREMIAALANEFDRGSEPDAGHHLEEEQL